MLHVVLGEEIKRRGKWRYCVSEYGVEGISRQPLLDACRQIKSLDEAAAAQQIGLYWPGKANPSMVCTVGWGAKHTVDESRTVFAKWKPHPGKRLYGP